MHVRAIKLFGLGAALGLLAFFNLAAWAEVVWAQEQIAIYRVLPVQVTRDSVLKLAREAFGMSSPQVSEDDVAFMLVQEQKRLTVWKASGAILFADGSKLWNPAYEITSPADAVSAVQLALHFLKTHNLLPPQAVTEGVLMPIPRLHSVKRLDGQEVYNHWSVDFNLLVDSGSDAGARRIDKSQLLIRLGQEGEIIGLERHWRDLGERQLVAAVTQEQARELLAWKLGLPVSAIPSVGDMGVGMVYTLHYEEEPQAWLYPVYGLSFADSAQGMIGGGIVPASTFSILARIVSPKPEARFKLSDPIELRAEVRAGFGTPPYRYEWYSVKDGLISQAATARVRLSQGLHQLWLYVIDRNGTQDFQTLFIDVEGSSHAVAPQHVPFWLIAVLVSSFGVLGSLGFRRRGSWLRRLGLLSLVIISLTLVTPGTAQQAGRFPPCTDKGNDSDCSLFNNKLKFQLSLTPNDGLMLSNLRWKTHLVYSVANGLLFPYLQLEFTGQAQPLRVELDATKNTKYSVKELRKDCTWEFQTEYDPVSLPAVTKPGTPAGQEVRLKVTQSYVFYNSKRGCSSAPEFYPQLRYELTNLNNLTAGVSFQKIRIFLRGDFDVEGTKQEQGLKTGQEQRDVAVMVREYILTPGFSKGLLPLGLSPFCEFDFQQNQIRPRVLQVAGERAVVVCREKEFGTPTEKIEDFDNYHQAHISLWVPGCSISVLTLGLVDKGLPCVHLHQTIGYATGDGNLPGGKEAGSGWMPQVKIKQKLYAVQYNAREVDGDPEGLTNNQKLTDIVMWWVFEADHFQAKPEGIIFPHDKRKFPWLYGAFSCGLLLPVPNPPTYGTPYCP